LIESRLEKEMKTVLYLPVLTALLLGSFANADEAVDLQDFEQYRQMMLPVLTNSLEPLRKTRKCLVGSGNSDQLNTCIQIMAETQRSTMPGGGKATPQMPRMEWSRALVEQLRGDLDRSLINTGASIKCLQSSNSHQAMGECMQKAGAR
jgi:hypothetical protein